MFIRNKIGKKSMYESTAIAYHNSVFKQKINLENYKTLLKFYENPSSPDIIEATAGNCTKKEIHVYLKNRWINFCKKKLDNIEKDKHKSKYEDTIVKYKALLNSLSAVSPEVSIQKTSNVDIHYVLGKCYMENKKFAEAKNSFDKIKKEGGYEKYSKDIELYLSQIEASQLSKKRKPELDNDLNASSSDKRLVKKRKQDSDPVSNNPSSESSKSNVDNSFSENQPSSTSTNSALNKTFPDSLVQVPTNTSNQSDSHKIDADAIVIKPTLENLKKANEELKGKLKQQEDWMERFSQGLHTISNWRDFGLAPALKKYQENYLNTISSYVKKVENLERKDEENILEIQRLNHILYVQESARYNIYHYEIAPRDAEIFMLRQQVNELQAGVHGFPPSQSPAISVDAQAPQQPPPPPYFNMNHTTLFRQNPPPGVDPKNVGQEANQSPTNNY